MSARITRFFAAAACMGALLSQGCGRRPPPIKMPSVNASAAASKAVKKYDTDGNGKIDAEELEKSPALKVAQDRIDSNGDGSITAAEIANEIKLWQDAAMGRMEFTCIVTQGKSPLKGATVKFVPEEFLGKNFQTAEGITDDHGMAAVSIPDADPPGISPGLYRVEITKQGVEIPAKYNTETIFGCEISTEATSLSGDPVFRLD